MEFIPLWDQGRALAWLADLLAAKFPADALRKAPTNNFNDLLKLCIVLIYNKQ